MDQRGVEVSALVLGEPYFKEGVETKKVLPGIILNRQRHSKTRYSSRLT